MNPGCTNPSRLISPHDHDAEVQSWVRASHAHLDGPLAGSVATWLEDDWPWERPFRHGR